jgi:hypothetical protein
MRISWVSACISTNMRVSFCNVLFFVDSVAYVYNWGYAEVLFAMMLVPVYVHVAV